MINFVAGAHIAENAAIHPSYNHEGIGNNPTVGNCLAWCNSVIHTRNAVRCSHRFYFSCSDGNAREIRRYEGRRSISLSINEFHGTHDLVPPEMRILRPASAFRSSTVTWRLRDVRDTHMKIQLIYCTNLAMKD